MFNIIIALVIGFIAPARAQSDDQFLCEGPYQNISPATPIVDRKKDVGSSVKPNDEEEACLPIPRLAVVIKMVCYTTAVNNHLPTFQCPLNENCFGNGVFLSPKRRILSNNNHQICITFKSTSKWRQDTLVKFDWIDVTNQSR